MATYPVKSSNLKKRRNRLKTLWWKHLRPLWNDYQWPVMGAFALVALTLGYIGFEKHFDSLSKTRSPLDIFYFSLQLFVMESGSVTGLVPWALELARLLAPAVVAYTAAKALVAILYEQLQLLRVRFIRDHVVVCGLGRKGILIVKAFHDLGYRVVVIDQDEENSKLDSCRELGVIVLIGNASDSALIRKAHIHKARYLFSVCSDDGVNAEVAVHARELTGNRKGKVLTCFIHISDLKLRNLFREKEIATQKIDSFRLEFFNIFESGARAMLHEHPACSQIVKGKGDRRHMFVIGLGRMGESLVVQAAKIWWTMHTKNGEHLRITIIDKAAKLKMESLCLRYPRLDSICTLNTYDMDIQSPQFQRAEFLFDAQGHCDVTIIYVSLDDDEQGLSAALTLLQRVRTHSIPIVVRMTQDAGLASLLQGEGDNGGDFGNLHAFGLLELTCNPDLLLGGTHEILARAIHKEYVRNQDKEGHTPCTNPSMIPWGELPDSLKDSNRLIILA